MSLSELKNKYYQICIPVRTILLLSIILTPKQYMNYWLYPAILTLFVVLYRYISYDDTQKGAFGRLVHWQNMRIIHILIIIIFILSIMYSRYDIAKVMPIIDIVFSLLYMHNRYK
jgi:hypothetical protein